MSIRELILLSPYRLPTQSTLYLADDEVASFLYGYRALWHPAAIAGAIRPPHAVSPYDHEQPQPGFIYAVPEIQLPGLPDDWNERVRDAGAIAFHATPDPIVTLANLRDALRNHVAQPPETVNLLNLDAERTAAFFGIGFGFLCIEALFEAMNYDNLIDTNALWTEVQSAATALTGSDPDASRRHLQAAAERLLAAREVLYPTSIHVVDLWLPDSEQCRPSWSVALDKSQPLNVIACAALLERLHREQPELLTTLREKVTTGLVEVCGGPYLEREDILLPLESQLWNLTRGQSVYRELLGREVRVFARRKFGHQSYLPLLLQNEGISRALLLTFDESVLPSPRGQAVSWSSPDGKQVEAFCRVPLAADSPQTFFHLTHHLYETIMQDSTATLALLHRGKPAHACYNDWLELTRLAPVLGRWTTLSDYFETIQPGESLAPTPDEFRSDYLSERTSTSEANLAVHEPVSAFARQIRARRLLDSAWTLAAMCRSLGSKFQADAGESVEVTLNRLEEELEAGTIPAKELPAVQERIAIALAQRLVTGGKLGQAGFLVLNPCSFERRVALELPDVQITAGGPVKACQPTSDGTLIVVEVPALGFAWIPRTDGVAAAAPATQMRLADERTIRNEFFEAEIDPSTGGLKVIRDMRTRTGRLGQQLVFNPGSTMRAKEVRVTSMGPVLGEIITEGILLDAQNEVIATFHQRFRAWLGRPVLELRIEIRPTRLPHGYPWHDYYGARFAWRDERATLMRGVLGTSHVTSYTRPETPDFLEIREGRQSTILFPGSLPFHQRHGSRMLDVILIPEGEQEQVFELGIGLDRNYPMQTALGLITPAPVVPTDQGPPRVGSTGWLFHLDAMNLLLTTLRPAIDGSDAVTATLLECGYGGGVVQLRCVRDLQRAQILDGRGQLANNLAVVGDTVQLDIGQNDLAQVYVKFS